MIHNQAFNHEPGDTKQVGVDEGSSVVKLDAMAERRCRIFQVGHVGGSWLEHLVS
jgi:hypothetical protein